MKRETRRLPPWTSAWMIVALGAVVRAIVVGRTYEPHEEWRGDPLTYADILQALLAGRIDPAMWVWPPGFPIAAIPFQPLFGPGVALHLVSWIAGVAALALLVACGRWLRAPLAFGTAAVVLAFFPEAVIAAARPLPASFAILASLGAVVGLEAACRGGHLQWAAVGGLAAAAAVLSRPECALSVPLYALISLLGRRRPWRAVVLYAAVTAVTIAPYAIAFRNASGTWGISIKPHLNVLKIQVYQRGSGFAERNALWEEFLEPFSDDEGRVDPRRIVEAADTRAYFLGPDALRTAASNFVYAFRRDPLWVNLLWLVGIGGLVLGRGRLRERLHAAAFAAPVLSVAMLFPPVERYALITVPAFGFGVGCAIVRVLAWAPSVPRSAWTIMVAVAAVLGTLATTRQLATYEWIERYAEFLVERSEGNVDGAEAILREAIRADPSNPEAQHELGSLLQERGDLAGAMRAFQRSVRLGGSPVPLAAMYTRAGRRQDAEALLAPLRRSPPDAPDYWSVVGQLAMMERDWLRAGESFARAEELGGPADVLALNRGMALSRAGRIPEARESLLRAGGSTNPTVRQTAAAELARLGSGEAP